MRSSPGEVDWHLLGERRRKKMIDGYRGQLVVLDEATQWEDVDVEGG